MQHQSNVLKCDLMISKCADTVVGVSVAILILLFAFQRFGTDKVGFTFAPIILIWFLFLIGIGLFNLFKHDITVLKALNPLYIIYYLRRSGKQGWISLGGAFLCITGESPYLLYRLYALLHGDKIVNKWMLNLPVF